MTTELRIVWGAVVVAAGQSWRFGEADKLLADLNGTPVICWSLAAMLSEPRISRIALVTSKSNTDGMRALVGREFERHPVCVCLGGTTRSDSVRSGLRALDPEVTHVAVHDGARPLITAGTVTRLLDIAERSGAAALAIQVTSSIGVEEDEGGALTATLDRTSLRELQTPQAARRSYLIDAIDRFPGESDESAALLRAGYGVSLVRGEPSNVKITVPEDLLVARALAGDREAGS